MAKKKIDLGMIATLCAAVLGVVAIIMLALPAVKVIDSETAYKGTEIVFGLKKTELIVGEVVYFEFSFMNLLTYLLAIVGVVFIILGFLGKGGKFASFIATVAFLLAGIFFFLQVALCVPGEGIENFVSGIGGLLGKDGSVKDGLELGAGAIIGGICSILAAVASGYKAFIAK